MSDAEGRAREAQQLLENPMLIEAFENVRTAAIEGWRKSPVRDAEAREKAFFTVRAADLIWAELESVVTNGKIAAARIQRPDPTPR